ncbi:protein lava lamp [Eurosta solidaginis]|uniref:protein lava lamp n=1 Tax=Eurosta solidaginis TaxID=178769 RepID=UPI003530ABD1
MSSNEANHQAANISNLQESFSKQQKKISALKELVRKSEVAHGKSTSTAQEKVKNIAQRLTHLKIKARSRHSQPTAFSPSTAQENENTSPFMSSDTGAFLSDGQPQQQQPQLSHSFSRLEQKVSHIPHSGQMTLPTSNEFIPLKQQHRSESTKSLSNTGSEKVQLLRQQMEQNKLLMAQRASSKQHLEQLVSQLKEKFDTTQQCLEDTSELGKSMSDLSALMACSPVSHERHKSATDLSSQPFSLEKERIKFLDNRCRILEKQLEKERQLHGNQEITNVNESVNQKRFKELENKVVELERALQESQGEVENKMYETKQLLEELKRLRSDINAKDQELCLMRLKQGDNVHELSELTNLENNDNERLRNELADRHTRINELQEVNDILEATRCDLSLKNNKFEEQLQQMKAEVAEANEKVERIQEELQRSEQLVETFQNSSEAAIVGRTSLVDTTCVQVNEEMAKQIQELQNKCDKVLEENRQLQDMVNEKDRLEVSDASIAEKIAALEATIESQRENLKDRQATISRLEEEVMEKTIELNVLNANFKVLAEKLEASSKSKSLFSSSGVDATDNHALETEIQQLKQKLDDSNKAMIKLKLKCKQTEKQVEKLKKSSDLHAEIVRLEGLNEELQQKVTELEDEKGQWQLTQVDTAAVVKMPATEKEQHSALEDLKEKLKTQAETIRLLEEQKYEHTQHLEELQSKLRVLQAQVDKQAGEESARVKSEMSEIHYEEQVEEQAHQLQQLEGCLINARSEVEEYKDKFADMQQQKQTLDKKLEKYIVENMELLDKIEKLSKSSSSAESIEIVERLTQQERAEIDEYQKRLDGNSVSSVSELTQTELAPELSDSLVKLREESSELMNKIELFTTERREVLERMEHLTNENHELIQKVEEITREKEELETNVLLANDAKIKLEEHIKELSKEKDQLSVQVAEFKVQGSQLSQELSSLQKSSEVVAALDSKDDAVLIQKCEKCLTNLSHELEIYRKASNMNAKFNASKKLAKEAKNAHTQLSELLHKVKEASTAVETVTVVETVVAVTAPSGKALAEYEQLTTQNSLLKQKIEDLRCELQEARESTMTEGETEPTTKAAAPTEVDAAKAHQKEKQVEELKKYEEQCVELQSTVENLRLQLGEALTADKERSGEVTQLNDELEALRKTSRELENLLDAKNLSYDKEVLEVTRLRKELEGKCDTYEGEMKILQTLIAEQKQQLIEAYKEHEHESNLKLQELEERDEEIMQLRAEIKELKRALESAGKQLSEDLCKECVKLSKALKINKNLVTEQVNELSNKQETIEILNQQIIDLYKTMEKNANNIIDKEDEITRLEEVVETNSKELEILRKDNKEQKIVVDKLLIELHSHRTTVEQIPQLENEIQRLQQENQRLDKSNKELEKRNKDQLEKMKKYAANLKKRAAQCQELEAKVNELEKGSLEAMQTKQQQDSSNEQALEATTKELEKQINDLKGQLEIKSKELAKASDLFGNLKNEMEQLEKTLIEKNNEIVQLQIALVDAQDQASGWGNSVLDATNTNNAANEEIQRQLEEQAYKLKEAEAEIYSMQEELIQVRESEREKDLVNRELQETLAQKNELLLKLQQQIQHSTHADNITDMLEEKVHSFEERLQTLNEELKAKSLKFEKSKAVIKERNNQIQRLQAQLKDLQDKLSAHPEEEYVERAMTASNLSAVTAAPTQPQVPKEVYDELQTAYDKLNERFNAEQTNFQATIGRLETLHDGIQAKLQENMAYIETLEQENANYKDKICRLEEGIASFEERRASMERRTNILCAQMQTRETEHEKAEDELIYRLNMLSEHDDVIGHRLLQAQEEKDELLDRIERIQAEFNGLSNNYAKIEKEYQTYRNQSEIQIETETQSLREQLKEARTQIEHIRLACDTKLAAKDNEFDELESELSEQLSKMNSDKRAVAEDLERSRDECNAQKDEIVRLKESLNASEQAKQELERESTWLRMQNEGSQQDQYELQELRMQTLQDKTEIDNLRHQIETLAANHEVELQALRTQISELDTLRMQVGQNQTDDQVFIETENKRLTDLLTEKEAIIENYQRQNLQLQMAAVQSHTGTTASQHDSLALAFGSPQQSAQAPILSSTAETLQQGEENARLEQQLQEKNEQIARLQRELNTVQSEFHNVLEGNHEMQRQLMTKSQEIESLRNSYANFNTPTAAAVFGQPAQQDVIPAPPLFFSNDQAISSPFDEIVQVRTVDNLGSSRRTLNNNNLSNTLEQPTIEDLQRNVSDLEKHAQDLENKLATRNQRELEIEERLRQSQQAHNELERQLRERADEVKKANAEMKKVQDENVALRLTEQRAQQQIEEFQNSLSETQRELNERNEQMRQLQNNVQQQQTTANENSDFMGLGQLQGNLEHLQKMLQQRDDELKQLRDALNDEKTLKERTAALENQIIPDSLASLGLAGAPNPVPTLDMFFGGSSGANEFETLVIPSVSDVPVVEKAILPEKAYICQPKGGEQVAHSDTEAIAFDLDADWGDAWGAQEAAAEEAHFTKTSTADKGGRMSLVPREQQLELQLVEQAERIAELELAVERCEQQKQEMQVKSGKLMKKLKEYKTKIDELQNNAAKSNSSTTNAVSSFFDLDAAIQDELKIQIKQLEERLQEERKQHELHGVEKEKLLKRIDVLTAGSERMAEMKERQDLEVQMYQSRIQELQAKVNNLKDWGPDGETSPEAVVEMQKQQQVVPQSAFSSDNTLTQSNSSPPSNWVMEKQQLNQRISELTAEIRDINVDRQELQALLEEEKSNVIRAEESLIALQQQLVTCDTESVANENEVREKFNSLKAEHIQLQEKYNTLHATYEEQTGELNRIRTREEQLVTALQQAEIKLQNSLAAGTHAEQLQAELLHTKSQLSEASEAVTRLEKDLDAVQTQLLELQTKNYQLLQANEELRSAEAVVASTANSELLSEEMRQLRERNNKLEERVKQLKQEIVAYEGNVKPSAITAHSADVDELNAQLQEKESEIMHLKQRIEDLMREDQTEKLVLEILTKNQEIHMLKLKVKNLEDDKQELEHNLAVQITNEMQVNKNNIESENAKLHEKIKQLEEQLQILQSEKRDMEEELKVLNNHVMSSLENEDKLKSAALQLDTQNIEITELRRTIEALKESDNANISAPPTDYAALNAQWEAIVEQKCGEIAKMWREHLEQREAEFKLIETRLRDEITALHHQAQMNDKGAQQIASGDSTATSTPASVSTTQSGTSSATASKDGTPLRHRIINEEHEADADVIIEKMQAALESQEMEIVTLKEQLAIRSAEYARLAAQYDPFKLQNTSSHSNIVGGAAATAKGNNAPSSNDSSVVPKSELDFALYMLHQRDMRCEEMTLELVSLLEERDTLQLKLSNTLRQVEAIKAETNYIEPPNAPADNTTHAAETTNTDSVTQRGVVSPSSRSDSTDELSQKLSQLQTVNHSKDKVIKEERDQRIRQMEKIQQDVAKMPQAAVSELVGTEAAQSGQSPSSVLLNWLWGNKPDNGSSAPH